MTNKKDTISIRGIVLRQTFYKENDAIITSLGSDGLFSFYARGVNKISSKNFAPCSLLMDSCFILNVSSNNKKSLKEGAAITSYLIDKDFSSLALSNFIIELTLKTMDEDDDEGKEIYPYFLSSLKAIKESDNYLGVGVCYFIKTLSILGYGLNLNSCIRCQKSKSIVGISYEDGGFVCADCFNEKDYRLNAETMKFLHYCNLVSPDKIALLPKINSSIFPIIENLGYFIEKEAGISLKTIKLLKVI